jgi:hypothetical protein
VRLQPGALPRADDHGRHGSAPAHNKRALEYIRQWRGPGQGPDHGAPSRWTGSWRPSTSSPRARPSRSPSSPDRRLTGRAAAPQEPRPPSARRRRARHGGAPPRRAV